MIWYGDPESTGRVTLGIPAGLLSRQLPAGLALGRGTLGTSLLEECLELSQQPAEDPESKAKEGVIFAINKKMFKSFLL